MLDDSLHCVIIKEAGAGSESVDRSPDVTDMAARGPSSPGGGAFHARRGGMLRLKTWDWPRGSGRQPPAGLHSPAEDHNPRRSSFPVLRFRLPAPCSLLCPARRTEPRGRRRYGVFTPDFAGGIVNVV